MKKPIILYKIENLKSFLKFIIIILSKGIIFYKNKFNVHASSVNGDELVEFY